MSTANLCTICEAAVAVESCRRCGAQVCREHFAESTGMCLSCAQLTGDR